MEQQTTNCKIGRKLEGVVAPFSAGAHPQKFYELSKMVVQQALADVAQRKEAIRKQAHEWMGQPVNSVGSLAYWTKPTPTDDALGGLNDDERRVLSAALDPKFDLAINEYCSRERFRQQTAMVLRKLRVLN